MAKINIAFLVFVTTVTIVRGEFIARTYGKKSVTVQKVLYHAEEASKFQCVHRCMRISKDAVMEYEDVTMKCKCVEIDGNGAETKEEDESVTLSGTFKRKEIKPPISNVALKKASEQSSTETYYGTPNGAENANDGDMATRSFTRSYKNTWWQVDLGATFKIGIIKLFLQPRAMSEKWYGDLTVLTRVDETDVWVVCGTFVAPTELILQTYCQHAWQTRARYVRVANSVEESLVLSEVEVYA